MTDRFMRSLSCHWSFFKILCFAVAVAGENFLEGTIADLRCDIAELRGNELQRSTFLWKKGIVEKAEGTRILYLNSPDGGDAQVSEPSLVSRARFKPPVLTITDLKVSDSGYYSCEITKPDGTRVTEIIEVEVNAIPLVSVRRIDNPIINEDTGLYEAAVCQALRSKPKASVYWINTQTGRRLESSDDRIVVSADKTSNVTSVLRLKPGLIGRALDSADPVTPDEMQENFTCVVVHDWLQNKELQETITLELLYPPRASISVNGNRLFCDVVGNPMPSITWTRPDGTTTEGRRHIYINQSTPNGSSGRYVCQAKSSIAPAAAVIDIERPERLPTILSTTLRYETAIPLSAKDFDMECKAELEGVESFPMETIFKWTRNGVDVEENEFYKKIVNTSIASPEKTIVSSTLRIAQVTRSIHGCLFECRVDMANQQSGYVRSVERSIKLKVDYPPLPGSISISVHPHPAAQEGEDVILRCSATSMPPSSYRWFYEGRVISSASQLRLRNVSRFEAGRYKCVASNYVPGSASSEASVIVHYPPGDVTITKTPSSLVCSTAGGSLPVPFYLWLLPNGTTTEITQNTSVLNISSLDTSEAAPYVCVVRNILAERNSTYFLPPSNLGIGSLSVAEFSGTMVVVFLAIVVLISTIFCFIKRRNVKKESSSESSPALKQSNLNGYDENSSIDGSFASTPSPRRNMFDDDNITFPNFSDAVRTDASIEYAGDSKEMSSKLKSVETLDESGVEIFERSSYESPVKSVKPCPMPIASTIETRLPSGQLKLSTFSQLPTSTGTFNGAMPNYFTIRNPSRHKYEAPLTRAFSETFKAGHLGLSPKVDNGLESRLGLGLAAVQGPKVNLPPAYNHQTFVFNSGAGRGGISIPTPISKSSISGDLKEDKNTLRHINAAALSPKRVTSPAPPELLTKMDKIPQSKSNIWNNLISRNVDRACSPLDYRLRDAAIPSRCQSVDTSGEGALIVDFPDRKYTYQPYANGSMSRTSTTVSFNKSKGTDSSTCSTSGTNGGKFQSLTLV